MSKKRFDDIPFGGKFKLNFNVDGMNFSMDSGYKINKVIYNGIATIVFWDDGTKTVAKFDDDGADLYSEFTGLMVAVMKKLMKPSQFKQIFVDWLPEDSQDVVTLTDVRNKHKIVESKKPYKCGNYLPKYCADMDCDDCEWNNENEI